MNKTPHIFHAFSTFGAGGPQVRTVHIVNRLGTAFRHTFMAMDGNFEAIDRIDPGFQVALLRPPRKRAEVLYPLVLRKIIKGTRPDLLITYNWGAIEAAIGARIGSVCPVVHTEDGFGLDEAASLKLRRVVARRLVLNTLYRTVVPSKALLQIALTRYKLRPDKVKLIPNGADVERFRPWRDPELRSCLGVAENTLLFGYVGGLREEKNLSLLVVAFARAQLQNAKIALIGDGPCRPELERLTRSLGITDRVIFTGFVEDPIPYYAGLDVFVMSSATEQMPMSLLEAMACGLPAICTEVGDTSEILGGTRRPVIAPPGDVEAYAESLRVMAGDPELRSALGTANRNRCVAHYSLRAMILEYANLYYAATRANI